MHTGSMEVIYGGSDSSRPITQPNISWMHSKVRLASLTVVTRQRDPSRELMRIIPWRFLVRQSMSVSATLRLSEETKDCPFNPFTC